MNAAQQAAIERARARGQGSTTGGAYDFTEEQERDFTEPQRAALERARSRGQSGLSDTDTRGKVRTVADFAGGIVGAVPKAAGGIVSLGSLVPGVNVVADPVAEALMDAGEWVDDALLSDYQKNINAEMAQAIANSARELGPDASIGDHLKNIGSQTGAAAKFVAQNPSQAAMLAGQAIPYLFGGGLLARGAQTAARGTQALVGAKATGLGAGTAGAVGEGLMAGGAVTGDVVGQLRDEGITEYTADRLVGIPAGAATAVIGRLGAKLGGGLDADTVIANKLSGEAVDLMTDAPKRGLIRRVGVGAATEGTEEFFQSGSEEAFTNLGVGDPISQDVGSSAALGAAAGMGVGGVIGGLQRSSNSESRAAELNAEEQKLIANQAAEDKKAKELEAEAVRQQGLTRMTAAKSFVPFSKFKSERDAKRNADVLNPQTEIGQAYVEYKLTANKYPANEKEEKALVKKFLKDFIPQDDGEVAIDEFNQALDQHAAAVASGAVTPTLNDKPKPAPAPEAEVAAPVEQTQAQDTQEEAAPAKAPKPESAKVAEARAYAEEVLGKDWETTGGLSQEFAERKGFYKKGKDGKTTWQRSVDREAAALQETTTPEVTEEAPVNALLDNEGLRESLKPQQVKVYDALLKAVDENATGNLITVEWKSGEKDNETRGWAVELNNTELAKISGIENSKSAKTAVSGFSTAFKNALSGEQVREALIQKGALNTEAETLTAEEGQQFAAGVGGDGTLATIGTAGGTQVEGASANQSAAKKKAETQRFKDAGMTDEQIKAFFNPENEAASAEAELGGQVLEDVENARFAVDNADKLLRAQWAANGTPDGPSYDDLSMNNKIDWMETVYSTLGEANQSEVLSEKANSLREITDATTQDNESGRTEVQEPSGDQTGAELPADTGRGTEADTKPAEGDGESFTAGETKAPAVETKPKKKLRKKPDTKFGVPNGSFEPASRAAFEQEVKNLTGSTTNMRIHVFDTEADALAAIEEGSVPEPDMPMLKRAKPFGWVVEDENGEPNAHFILDRVPAGREKSAFLHEVGGHVGIDAILEENDRRMIATQIYRWAGQNDNSLESITARRTISRIGKAADLGAVSEGSIVSEAVAYFLEEAALAGVEPSTNSTVGKFVKKLRDLFLAAFDRLGFNVAELTAQDVIDLAYGAAYIELMHGRTEVNTQNPVTFSPSMTATENNGEVDPLLANREGETRFGVPESETQNQVSWTSKRLGTGAAEMLTNLRVLTEAPLDATKNLDRLIRENEEKMPSARKWFDFMLAAEATKNEIFGLVEDVINQSRQFTMERQELVNDFLGASTFYQKWGYDPQWTDRKTGKSVKVTIDPTMKKKYDRLTAEEQQLVRDVFAHGRTMQAQMQEVAEKLGVSKFFKFDSRLQGPYAPLKRFGNYVGELKSQELLDAEADLDSGPTPIKRKKLEELKSSGDHYVISFFESLGAAQTFVNANQDKFAYADAAEKAVTYEESRPGGAQAYEKILGAVNANLAGLDQSSKDAMAKLVRDMYFQTLDDSNARLSGTKRLNRAGYDKNMLRAFAEHGMAQANLIAQMKHGGDISTALVGAYKEARKTSSQLMPVYNKIALKFQRTMTPRTGMLADLETNVMKFNSFYMLTSSLGYFFQNMTQPYFAVAQISGEFGWRQAQTWGKLLSGYGVAKKVINTSFLNQVKNVTSMGLLGGNSTVELDIDKAPPELRPVLKELQLRGVLDVGVTEDLRHVNMSPNVAVRAYDEMTHRLYQSARYVEANNRIASAVAAFKMAQANPQKMKRLKLTPAEFAIRIVQDTQGNFSKLDAPAAFDVLPKAPLQFRKYQFQMGWLHIDAAKQAFRGADPDMKKAGFRKLSLMMGYTGVFGGLASVPMANVASSVVQAVIASLSGDDEENPPKSLERWIRENVEDERTATLLTRGVPAALGWDFSQKLDQSDLFMPYNSKYVQMDPSRDGSLLFAAQLALGPTGTVVGNIGNISDFINRGNYYRAAEYAMPKGMRSYLETMRFAGRGYETRSGLEITNPTQFDVVDLLTNAIGLPSTDINQIKWTRGQQVEITQWFSKETARIKRGYLSAHEDRDRAAKARYRDEFRELQKAKDRVRPFFNDSRSVLKRASVSELIRAPRARAREQRRLDSVTGN